MARASIKVITVIELFQKKIFEYQIQSIEQLVEGRFLVLEVMPHCKPPVRKFDQQLLRNSQIWPGVQALPSLSSAAYSADIY